MKETKKIEQYQPFFLPLVILISLILTSFFFLKPKITESLKIGRQLSSSKKRLAQLTQKAADLKGLDKAELMAKSEVLLEALPTEKNLPQLLLTFRNLAQEANINLLKVQVSPGELATLSAQAQSKSYQKTDVPFLAFSLALEGESENVKDFLDKIQSSLPFILVEKVNLAQEENEHQSLALSLNTFFLALPTQLGQLEKPLVLMTSEEEKTYQQLDDYQLVVAEESIFTTPSGRENPFSF